MSTPITPSTHEGPAGEPSETCDCHECALEFSNRYRAALAGISEEMGLPLSMGPARGDLKRLLEHGRHAMQQVQTAPRAVSVEADFDQMTWTFSIAPNCRVSAGRYAIVYVGPDINKP